MLRIKKYRSVRAILNDYPDSVVIVGTLYGHQYHRICNQLYLLSIKPLALYVPPYSNEAVGLAVLEADVQGIADRYYKTHNLYINNTLKIYGNYR